MTRRWIWLVPSYIWVISHLAGTELAIYPKTGGEQVKHVSVVLTGFCRYSTSHGLETA